MKPIKTPKSMKQKPSKLKFWYSENEMKEIEESMKIINLNLNDSINSTYIRYRLNEICCVLRIKRIRKQKDVKS